MKRDLLLTCWVLAACGSTPARPPSPSLASSPAAQASSARAPAPEPAPESEELVTDLSAPISCRCDVIGFESDGPPKGTCELVFDEDGSAKLTTISASPSFSAVLTPKPKSSTRVYYAFEGVFDFACDEAWCGRQELSVLAVAELDYRVTVARSDDGPPSHVLWVSCGPEPASH